MLLELDQNAFEHNNHFRLAVFDNFKDLKMEYRMKKEILFPYLSSFIVESDIYSLKEDLMIKS